MDWRRGLTCLCLAGVTSEGIAERILCPIHGHKCTVAVAQVESAAKQPQFLDDAPEESCLPNPGHVRESVVGNVMSGYAPHGAIY
jgi:hypothetical protein